MAAAKKSLIALGGLIPTNLAYTENTVAIHNVIGKLESEEYAEEITLVGATQQVADLKAANEDFDKTYSSRTAERYARINPNRSLERVLSFISNDRH